MHRSGRQLLAALLISLLVASAAAQEFTVEPDSTEGVGYMDSLAVFASLITNMWDQESRIAWVNEPGTPEGWTVEICQGSMVCWPPWVLADTLELPASGSDTLLVKFKPQVEPGVGRTTITLTAVADTTIRRVLTFTLEARPAAVRPGTAEDRPEWRGWRMSPWGGSSGVSYNLPIPAAVKISLYDIQGKLVAVVWEGRAPAGKNVVRLEDLIDLSSGIYLIRLDAQGYEPIHCKTVKL